MTNIPLLAARRFYVGLSLFMMLIAAVGFWPSYYGPLLTTGTLDKSPILHVHAAVYTGWLALFLFQSGLAATGRVALHRKVGQLGLIWGLVLLVVGLVTTIVRFAFRVSDGRLEEAQAQVLWPLLDMVIFAAFFAAAAVYRAKPETHKRLMIVATTNLLVAAAGRAVLVEGPGTFLLFLGLWVSPILVAMLYDFSRRRLVHPVYVIGVVVLVVSSFRDALASTNAWLGFTQWLSTVVV